MCGIMIAFKYSNRYNKESFIDSTRKVEHRGPDNIGEYIDSSCFLGHTRLSIIDVDEHANQPYYYNNLIMVYNGEIFNYLELKDELVDLGYSFDTTSDTEVVLKSFYEWGSDCFSKFNGMWSLVIYDKDKENITVSRDRYGQKPLFIIDGEDGVFIASEIQQLVKFTDKKVNYRAIEMFLKEGRDEDNREDTFFTDIKEFPKAHYCTFEKNLNISSVNYWNYWSKELIKADENSFVEFRELFEDAVKLRLRSDVPYGVLLSGGIDSTLVSSTANRYKNSDFKIPAFTYSSKDESDESKYAQAIADDLNMNLVISEQDNEADFYISRLEELIRHLGKGHGSPAIVSIDYLYENASKHGIKIALDGQGADELLAGYQKDYLLRIPIYLFSGKFKEAYYIFKALKSHGILSQTILFLRHIAPPSIRKLMRSVYGYEELFKPFRSETTKSREINRRDKIGGRGVLNKFWIKFHDEGLESLIYYGDIIAMKNSIENRSPFMDHRLVEYVFSRTDELKMHHGKDKYVLRTFDDYKKYKKILERKKIGFTSKIKMSTKERMVDDLKDSPMLDWPIFSDKLKKLINNREAILSAKFERILFRLYQVHLWNRLFIAQEEKAISKI